jgi:hypothetical protein
MGEQSVPPGSPLGRPLGAVYTGKRRGIVRNRTRRSIDGLFVTRDDPRAHAHARVGGHRTAITHRRTARFLAIFARKGMDSEGENRFNRGTGWRGSLLCQSPGSWSG